MEADEKIKTQRDTKSECPEVLILKEMQMVKVSTTLGIISAFKLHWQKGWKEKEICAL